MEIADDEMTDPSTTPSSLSLSEPSDDGCVVDVDSGVETNSNSDGSDTETSILEFMSSSEGARLADSNPKVFAVLAGALNNNFNKYPGLSLFDAENPGAVSKQRRPNSSTTKKPTPRSPPHGIWKKFDAVKSHLSDPQKRRGVAVACACVLAFIFLAVFRDLVYQVTLWLEGRHPVTVALFCVLLYFFLSLPMTFGYIVVNMAAGYLFGVVVGTLVTVVTVALGVALAHVVMKLYFRPIISGLIAKALPAGYYKALFKLLAGPEALKIIFLTRLTPIPFGLQNAIFAATNVTTKGYLYATVGGLFPTQCLNVYLGSTLRSLGDILSEGGLSLVGYVVLVSQAGISMALMWMVLRKAKAELLRAVSVYDLESSDYHSSSAKNFQKRRIIWA